MKKLNLGIYVLVIASLIFTGCVKKGSETEAKKDTTKEEKVMLTGKELFHGLWISCDFRMPKFLGIQKNFKYPDFFMYIDTKKDEITLRFVYDDEKKDYKLKIAFDEEQLKDMGDRITAKVINEKGEVREILFTKLNTYKELNSRNNFYCEFTDAIGEWKKIGKIKVYGEGTFAEESYGRIAAFHSWKDIDRCVKHIRGEYEVQEIEAEIDWSGM